MPLSSIANHHVGSRSGKNGWSPTPRTPDLDVVGCPTAVTPNLDVVGRPHLGLQIWIEIQ